MKRFLSLSAVLLLSAILLTACGGNPTGAGTNNGGAAPATGKSAYEYYKDVEAATKDIKSMQTTLDMKMNVAGMDMSAAGDIKFIKKSETDMEMATAMAITGSPLGDIDMNVYYKDSFAYINMAGMLKFKQEMDIEEAMNMAYASSTSSIEFAESDIIDSSVTSAPGGILVSFTLNGETLGGELGKMAGGGLEGSNNSADTAFNNVSYTILVGNGNMPKEIHISFEMGTDGSNYTVDMTDISYNSLTKIDFPADLDEYNAF